MIECPLAQNAGCERVVQCVTMCHVTSYAMTLVQLRICIALDALPAQVNSSCSQILHQRQRVARECAGVDACVRAGRDGMAVTLVPPSARLLAAAIKTGSSSGSGGGGSSSSRSVVSHAFSRQRGFSKKLKKGVSGRGA